MRSLIGILAVVALVLAAVLREMLLIIAAGLLVVAVIVSWIVQRKRTGALPNQKQVNEIAKVDLPPPAEQAATEGKASTEADLGDSIGPLGVGTPRPKSASSLKNPTLFDLVPEKPVAMQNTKRLHNNGLRHGMLPDASDSKVIKPILEGFCAALGAEAVCVLHHEEQETQESFSYSLLASAGRNLALLPGETFKSPEPLAGPELGFAVRTIETDISSRALGYNSSPGSVHRIVVGQLGTTNLLFIADTTLEKGLTHRRVPELFNHCTGILGLLFDAVDPKRPRHEIITDEMAVARAKDQDLALVIVVLLNDDAVRECGETTIREAEQQLQEMLEQAGPDTRVEQFGQLAFGIFIDGELRDIESWFGHVTDALEKEDGLLSGGVAAGVAVLSDHHQTRGRFSPGCPGSSRQRVPPGRRDCPV